jgi:hypothetical protein
VIPPVAPNGQSDPKLFSQDDIDAARKQEKDKLYKRLETMQEQVSSLQAEAKKRADAEAARQKELQEQAKQQEAAAKRAAEEEMSTKDLLTQKEQEWQAQLQQVQLQVEQERALRERESQFAQLMDYRQQIMAQYQERIAPQLMDLINGETPEEILQSAEDLAARTDRMVAEFDQAQQTVRQQMPTARVTAPASGQNTDATRQFTPEDIRGMSMAEYVKNRRSILGGGAGGPKNRGFFG